MYQISLKISHEEIIELAQNGDLRAQFLAVDIHQSILGRGCHKHEMDQQYIQFFNELTEKQTSRGISLKQQLPILYKNKKTNRIEYEHKALFQATMDELYLKFAAERDGYGRKEHHIDDILHISHFDHNITFKSESNFKYFMSKKIPAIQKKWSHIYNFYSYEAS